MARVAFLCLRSWSLRVCRICLRRTSWLLTEAAARAPRARVSRGPALTIAWARLMVLVLAESPPANTKPRPATVMKARTAARSIIIGLFRRVEGLGQLALQAVIAGAVPEAWPGDAGGAELAGDASLIVFAGHLVDEQVLGHDHVAFEADDLGDVGDPARTVAQASGLDDHVDGADDHLANGARGQAVAAHGDHALDTADGFARAVGVEGAHRAVVAGVHGLEEVERLRAADFADDDPLGTHPQTVLHQVAHGDHALALEVRRPGFQAHHMRLLQLQFGCVLAGDDPLGRIDEGGHGVEQGGLARTRTAADQDVASAGADDAQDPRAFRTDGREVHQVLHRQLVFLELPDGQGRPVQRQRRRDDVDPRPVRQAGVADRAALVHAAADLRHDPLADV